MHASRILPCFFLAFALIVVAQPQKARACGGFFCSAQTESPIFQSGERIMFVQRDNGIVSMHIEVSYAGDPTEFAWLIPVLGDPTNVDGTPAPLSRAIQLSSSELFQRLQTQTNPTWNVSFGVPFPSECAPGSFDRTPSFGCGAIALSSAGGDFGVANERAMLDSATSETQEPDPFVLDTARVGPYDAQLIDTPESSDELFDWLNANGYYQDPAAKPLLAYYVSLGYRFIGIRLQNGKDNGDIRPILLNLPEGGPCVPLRLTGIAATADMPVRVWVLGPGRAIPKNFLHAVVNEQAVDYPGGGNYDQVVADAVAEAGGRAFVTEMALPHDFETTFIDRESLPTEREVIMMSTYDQETFDARWEQWGLPTSGPDYDAAGLEENPEFRRKRLVEEVALPALAIERAFRQTTHVTRFYTRIDPDDMTRDPIFSFNADMEMIPTERTMAMRQFTDKECVPHQIAQWDDGRRFTFSSAAFMNVTLNRPDVPALLRVEVAEEAGQPFVVHRDEIEVMDTVMDRAVLGATTLTEEEREQFEVAESPEQWPNPPAGFDEMGSQADEEGADEGADEGCRVGGQAVMTGYMLLALAFLIHRRRRAFAPRG